MRIFIAVELPKNIKERLNEVKIDKSIGELKYVSEHHLTLKFLGEIDEKKLEFVKRNLRGIRFKAFKLKLSKIGFFPNSNYISVVWAGLSPKRKLIELKMKIDDALMALFPREKRFEPHLTIGRVKNIKDREKFKEFFLEKEIEGEFKVSNFKVIKSELEKEGPIYEILEEY